MHSTLALQLSQKRSLPKQVDDEERHSTALDDSATRATTAPLSNNSSSRNKSMATRLGAQLRALSTQSYDKSKHRLLVIGGNGFVGSNILQRAVQKGIEVRSLNKSGKPQWQDVPWIDQVEWHQGDVFNADDLAKAVDGVTGVSAYSVACAWCCDGCSALWHCELIPYALLHTDRHDAVSTVGAFGSNEFMEKMCGESTIIAARAAQKAGASRL